MMVAWTASGVEGILEGDETAEYCFKLPQETPQYAAQKTPQYAAQETPQYSRDVPKLIDASKFLKRMYFKGGELEAPTVEGSWQCYPVPLGQLEFDLKGTLQFEWKIRVGDNDYLHNGVPLKYITENPEIVKLDIPSEDDTDLPWVRYDYDLKRAMRWYVITNASEMKLGALSADPEEWVCKFSVEVHSSGGQHYILEHLDGPEGNDPDEICQTKGFRVKVGRFQRTLADQMATVRVYKFDVHDMEGTYYIKTPIHNISALVGGVGPGGTVLWGQAVEDDIDPPKGFDELCADKSSVFKADRAVLKGTVYGVKEIKSVELTDLKEQMKSLVDKGEGKWTLDIMASEYIGVQPAFEIKYIDLLGNNRKYKCSYGQIKGLPITVTLANIEWWVSDEEEEDGSKKTKKSYSLSVKIDNPDNKPIPYKSLRMKTEADHDCKIETINPPDTSYEITSDNLPGPFTFTVNNVGSTCYQVNLLVTNLAGFEIPVKLVGDAFPRYKEKDHVWWTDFQQQGASKITIAPVPDFEIKVGGVKGPECVIKCNSETSAGDVAVAFLTGGISEAAKAAEGSFCENYWVDSDITTVNYSTEYVTGFRIKCTDGSDYPIPIEEEYHDQFSNFFEIHAAGNRECQIFYRGFLDPGYSEGKKFTTGACSVNQNEWIDAELK